MFLWWVWRSFFYILFISSPGDRWIKNTEREKKNCKPTFWIDCVEPILLGITLCTRDALLSKAFAIVMMIWQRGFLLGCDRPNHVRGIGIVCCWTCFSREFFYFFSAHTLFLLNLLNKYSKSENKVDIYVLLYSHFVPIFFCCQLFLFLFHFQLICTISTFVLKVHEIFPCAVSLSLSLSRHSHVFFSFILPVPSWHLYSFIPFFSPFSPFFSREL